MNATTCQLAVRLGVAAHSLKQSEYALADALDLDKPFFRGEDCRAAHTKTLMNAVVHWTARVEEIKKLLDAGTAS